MYCGKFASLFCLVLLIIFTEDVYYTMPTIAKNANVIPWEEEYIMLKVHNAIRHRLANGDYGNLRIGDMGLMDLDYNLRMEAQLIMNLDELDNFENITSQLPEGIVYFNLISTRLFPNVRNNFYGNLEGMISTWILAFMNPRFSCNKNVAMCKNIKQILYSKNNKMGCSKKKVSVHVAKYLCLYDKRFDNSPHLYQLGIPCSSCQEHQQLCYQQSLCASRYQCTMVMSCLTRKVMDYHVASDKMTFDAADSYCKRKNMQLPKIENSYTNTYIYGLAKHHYIGDYWINGNDKEKEGVYVNNDNVKLIYTNWYGNNQNNSSNKDCIHVKMNSKGRWNELPCNSKRNVICQNKEIIAYHVATNKMTFEAADCYCKGMNMQLPKIENSYTNKYIYDLAKHHYVGDYWLDGNDKEKEGVFVNTDNMKLLYTNWNPDQPDNSAYENCIHVKMDANGQWNDLVCNSERNVICQPTEIMVYHVATNQMTFEAANFYCKGKNMQLPKIENSYTNTYIYDLAKYHNIGDYWINGNDKEKEGVYVNSDNENLNYTNWYRILRKNSGNSDCIYVKTDANGQWDDLPCNSERNVICQPIQIKKYHVATEKMTFEAADCYCKGKNMQLSKIENSSINTYIYGWAKYHYVGDYWIDGNDKENEGYYVNTDNMKLTYTNWHTNAPDNTGNEDCVHVKMDAKGRWNDLPCNSKLNVICQPIQSASNNSKIAEMTSENDPICCSKLKTLCYLFYVTEKCPNTCNDPKIMKMKRKPSSTDDPILCTTLKQYCDQPKILEKCPKSCYKEYVVVINKMTFEAADSFCKEKDMQLPKIENSYSNTYIYNLADYEHIGGYWINGNDKEKEGVFVNTDNVSLTYTNWHINQSDNSDNEDCIYAKMNENGQWNNVSCNSKLSVICQPVPSLPYDIPGGKMTFDAADSYCKGIKMQLPKIKDSNTNTYIHGLAKQLYVGDYWINGNDKEKEGVYVNTDNVKLTYTNWLSNKPDNLGNADCIHVKVDANGQWNDIPCNSELKVICQSIESAAYNLKITTMASSDDDPIICKKLKRFCDQPKILEKCPRTCFMEYHVATDKMRFEVADCYCKILNMQLPKIENSYTNTYIYVLAKQLYVSDYWINGNDKESEGVYVNNNNVKLTYTNWHPNQPNNSDDEDCIHVQMNSNGQWNDVSCNSERDVICQPIESIKYHFATNNVSFDAAHSFCKVKNMQLPKIENRNTNAYIYGLAKQFFVGDYWINGNDKEREGVYVNTDNVKLTYTNWHPIQTYNESTADCIYVKMDANGQWNDLPCNSERNVICQPKENTSDNLEITTTASSESKSNDPICCKKLKSLCYRSNIMKICPNTCISEYHIVVGKMPFDKAHSYCKRKNMQLPKIENSYTNAFIYDLANQHRVSDYWINGNYKEKERVFVNTDNEKLTYTNWKPNNPLYSSNLDCIIVNMDTDGQWSDIPCTFYRTVICQPIKSTVNHDQPFC